VPHCGYSHRTVRIQIDTLMCHILSLLQQLKEFVRQEGIVQQARRKMYREFIKCDLYKLILSDNEEDKN